MFSWVLGSSDIKDKVNPFIEKYSLDERKEMYQKMVGDNQDHIPIIVSSKDIVLTKKKFVAPQSMTCGQLVKCIKQYAQNIREGDTILVLVNAMIIPSDQKIAWVHENYKNEDGFIYIDLNKNIS
jgi:hypothetical protein